MDRFCVSENYTIKELIDEFEYNNERVMIVINDNKKVIGVISQGDIIRALSSGIDIHSKILNIIQTSFLFLKKKNLKEAYKIFKSKKITLLPIIDDKYELIDVITLNDIYDYLGGK